ncbi:hypothetical protein E2C01_063940 [Portunus trituberculatus]|uniref:Uncharacterized protein n=1 Tax=Portunus trituberculatus TaxID=210409 RepID=A0A5B7HJ04_PORTR|nr:hypothetical protein [Portunus trituberculatus]
MSNIEGPDKAASPLLIPGKIAEGFQRGERQRRSLCHLSVTSETYQWPGGGIGSARSVNNVLKPHYSSHHLPQFGMVGPAVFC